jgi:hypothetical protein
MKGHVMKVTNIKLGIGFPLNFPMVPAHFVKTLMMLERPTFDFLQAYYGPIDEMRNELVKQALSSGCSHLIMMDTDMTYHPKTITRLLSHKMDVVGALCYRRYPPFDPLMMRGSINHYQTITKWKLGDLVEVDATGTGCLLFDMDVFKRMRPPWFKFRENPDESIGGVVGEDIGFCSDLRNAGYRIFVDTSVPAGHLTTLEVNNATWRLYSKMKDIAVEIETKQIAKESNGCLFEGEF